MFVFLLLFFFVPKLSCVIYENCGGSAPLECCNTWVAPCGSLPHVRELDGIYWHCGRVLVLVLEDLCLFS